MVVKEGRFGPYVTDGTTNASLRKGDTVEAIDMDRASELLAERRAAGPVDAQEEGGEEEGTGEEEGRGQEGDRRRSGGGQEGRRHQQAGGR